MVGRGAYGDRAGRREILICKLYSADAYYSSSMRPIINDAASNMMPRMIVDP